MKLRLFLPFCLGLVLVGVTLLRVEEALTRSVAARTLPIESPASAKRLRESGSLKPAGAIKPQIAAALRQMPVAFEENRGQTDPQVKFLARGLGYTLFLAHTEAVFALKVPQRATDCVQKSGWLGDEGTAPRLLFSFLRKPTVDPECGKATSNPKSPTRNQKSTVLRMKLEGANANPKVVGQEELHGKANYFIGNDPKKWRTGLATYGKLRYKDVYPGIDLVYYGNQGQLEYDFLVAPGADPAIISIQLEGANKLEVDGQGDLLMHTTGGTVKQRKPLIYQEMAGLRREITGRYAVRGEHQVGFELAGYDRTITLFIDPVLVYSTYLGGSGFDFGTDVASDGSGNVYLAGGTASSNFPTASALQPTLVGVNDVVVAKLNATGSALLYSTYLGGSDFDEGLGIAVDQSGSAYVTGDTFSTDFPTVGPLQAGYAGNGDAFVAKLNPTGSALVYSTYLGGTGFDQGRGIGLHSSGDAFVVGTTSSSNFPTASPFQPLKSVSNDAFVARLNATGLGLVYATFLGGSGNDFGLDIAVDANGNGYVVGFTDSANFPTANPLQLAFQGGFDVFVTKFVPSGNVLAYSTYLGGSTFDHGQGIAVDGSGSAYVTGLVLSGDFPTVSPLQSALKGFSDAFVAKLKPDGSALVYSTYLGGSSSDSGHSIAVDNSGNTYVVGSSLSADFPTTNAIQGAPGGGADAFVAKLNPSGSALGFSTYLGGSGSERLSGFPLKVAAPVFIR